MTAPEPVEPYRAAQRRAARDHLLMTALDLFAGQGYENTTVDEIATAAGMSSRTFFRYFGSKEAVVLGKFDQLADRLSSALSERPASESPWLALRRMLDYTVASSEDPDALRRNGEVQRVVAANENLRAAQLERMERVQARAAQVMTARLTDAGVVDAALRARTLVGAAFACMAVAGAICAETGRAFGETLDAVMGELPTALAQDAGIS